MFNLQGYLNEVYPITKGKFRIPILVSEMSINKEEFQKIIKELKEIIEKIKKEVIIPLAEGELKNFEDAILSKYKNGYKTLFENYEIKKLLNKGYVRADLVFEDNKAKLLEINSDFPDGVIMIDITAREISKGFNFEGEILENTPNFKELFEKNERIITYNDERIFVDEYYLQAKVLEGKVIEESKLFKKELKDVNLMRGLEIYRSKNPNFYFNFNQEDLINNMVFLLLGNKANLALLFDLEIFKENDKPEILPFTTFNYESIKNKKFVAKLLYSCGGQGIFFNKKVDNAIYQEEVKIDKAKLEFLDTDNKIKEDTFYYSFDPYLFVNNKIKQGNILLRFSKDKKLNVEANGGVGFWTLE